MTFQILGGVFRIRITILGVYIGAPLFWKPSLTLGLKGSEL